MANRADEWETSKKLCLLLVLTHSMGFVAKKKMQTVVMIKGYANIDTVQIFGKKIEIRL